MPTKNLPSTLALGLVLLTLEADAAGAPRSVLDYYQEIPKSLLPDNMKYELKRTKRGWITRSQYSEAERFIPVTVDTKRGYLELSDDDDNAETNGSAWTQVAVFPQEDESPLIAINLSMSDGIASLGRIVFVEQDGGQWKAVTSNVFPALRLADFLEEQCLAALNEESKQKLGILFELPRQGTTIHASVMISSFMLKRADTAPPSDATAPCPENVSRELSWDKKAGRFILLDAAKPKGSPARKK